VVCFRGGNGPGPLLLLLHGGGLDSALTSWAPAWSELVAGGPVLAPDLPGFGASPLGDVPPTVHGYRDWLVDLLGQLEIERCVIAGLSLGGAVALEVGLAAPGRVAGLALLAPYGLSGRTPGGRLGWASVHLPGVDGLTYGLLRHSRGALRRSLGALLKRRGTLTEALVDEVGALLRAPDAGKAWRLLQRDEVRWTGPATDLRSEIASLRCPTVFLSGEFDLVPPADIHAAASALGARYVLVPGAGHWLPRDAPEEVAQELNALRAHIASL
jgi:pimeloyl-ACP methyl ester carboxylesterase